MAKVIRDGRESRGLRDAKVGRVSWAFKAIRDGKEISECKVPKEIRDGRVQVSKVLKATRGSRVFRDRRDGKAFKVRRVTRDGKAYKVLKATRVGRVSRVIRVGRDGKVLLVQQVYPGVSTTPGRGTILTTEPSTWETTMTIF